MEWHATRKERSLDPCFGAYRQKETGPAGDPALPAGRQAAAGDDAMDMRMMGQRRAPGMLHQRQPDARTQVPRIGGDLKQQAVDHRLGVIGDGANRCRQSEDETVVLDRQQVGLEGLDPAPRGAALTLRAMPVAARIVGDLGMLSGGAVQHLAAECRAAALLDRQHDLVLTRAEMAVLGLPPDRPPGHGRYPRPRADRSPRLPMTTATPPADCR